MSIVIYKQGSSDARLGAALLLSSTRSITWSRELEYACGVFEVLETAPSGGILYILGINFRPDELSALSRSFSVVSILPTEKRTMSMHVWKYILRNKEISPVVAKINTPAMVAGIGLLTNHELQEEVRCYNHLSDIRAIELIAYGATYITNHIRMARSFVDTGTDFSVDEKRGVMLNLHKIHIDITWTLICKSHCIMVSYTDMGLVRLWSIRTKDETLRIDKLARSLGGDGNLLEAGFSTRVPMNPMDTLTLIKKFIRGTNGNSIRNSESRTRTNNLLDSKEEEN